MESIKIFLTYLYFLFFGKRTTRRIRKVEETTEDITKVIAASLNYFQVTFHCVRMNYVIEYDCKFIPNGKFKLYKLFTTYSEKVPQDLKEVLKQTIYFPDLHGIIISEHTRRNYLMEAYVDLIINDWYKKNRKS